MSKVFELNDGTKIPSFGVGTALVNEDNGLEEMLNNALEAGIRHFDTAFFDQNECVIGKVFQSWLSSGRLRREDLYVVSKLPAIGMWSYRVNEFLKLSLQNLGLDYVDLYVIQGPYGFQYIDVSEVLPVDASGNVILDTQTHLEAIWKAMEVEVKRGRTKSIGISNFNEKQLQRILKSCRIPPAVLQVDVNMYAHQQTLKSLCDEYRITLSVSSTASTNGISALFSDQALVDRISQKYGKSANEIAYSFLIQLGTVVVQNATPEDVTHAMLEFELSQSDIDALRNSGVSKFALEPLASTPPGVENHPEFPWKDLLPSNCKC